MFLVIERYVKRELNGIRKGPVNQYCYLGSPINEQTVVAHGKIAIQVKR